MYYNRTINLDGDYRRSSRYNFRQIPRVDYRKNLGIRRYPFKNRRNYRLNSRYKFRNIKRIDYTPFLNNFSSVNRYNNTEEQIELPTRNFDSGYLLRDIAPVDYSKYYDEEDNLFSRKRKLVEDEEYVYADPESDEW